VPALRRAASKLSDGTTAAGVLEGTDEDLSDREAAIAKWSRKVVHDPNATTGTDVDRLREAGFSDREIFEATTWIAFRMAFSTINAALGAGPDQRLAEKAPGQVREAVTAHRGGDEPGEGWWAALLSWARCPGGGNRWAVIVC
jgi:hypothetical protein